MKIALHHLVFVWSFKTKNMKRTLLILLFIYFIIISLAFTS